MTKEDKKFVLLVEDTMTQALLYQHSFQQKGIETRVAKSATQALEIIQESKPSILVSDVNMPEQDGYQLCESIKSNSTTSDIKVVLLSSALDPSEIFKIVNCGCDDFILKTMTPEFIAGEVKILLDRKEDCDPAGHEKGTFKITPARCQGTGSSMELRPEQAANLIYSLYQSICTLGKEA